MLTRCVIARHTNEGTGSGSAAGERMQIRCAAAVRDNGSIRGDVECGCDMVPVGIQVLLHI